MRVAPSSSDGKTSRECHVDAVECVVEPYGDAVALRLQLAEVAFRIIDPHTRREVDHGIARVEVSGRAMRGVFAGDYRDLDLSGSELVLFEDDLRLAEEDLADELVDTLAARLAERVYDRLLRLIPYSVKRDTNAVTDVVNVRVPGGES